MARGRPRKNDDVLLKSAELIGWALGGLEREIAETRERLSALTTQANRLRTRLGRKATRAAASVEGSVVQAAKATRRRARMSAEGRKRISEMMRKRWAERKKKGLNKL